MTTEGGSADGNSSLAKFLSSKTASLRESKTPSAWPSSDQFGTRTG